MLFPKGRWSEPIKATAVIILMVLALGCANLHSYLLFHSLAELFSVIIGVCIFVVAWNSQRFQRDSYLLFLGVGFLYVAGLDLAHMLSYKGMGVLRAEETNRATQLWIAARYLESISLACAPLVLGRQIGRGVLLGAGGAVVALLLASIFAFGVFPTCYVEGSGLTTFKVVSEYVVCLMLIVAIVGLWRHRERMDRRIVTLLAWAMAITILQELAFTLYVDVYGALNMAGHLLKILAFFLIYKAIVETGLAKPYQLLFYDLKQSEQALRESEERFRSFMAHSPAAGWIVDADGRFRYISPGYYRMFQTGHRDLSGKTIADVYPADLANEYLQNNRRAMAEGTTLETVESGVRADGSPGQFLVVKFPIRTASGETLLGGMALDITRRQAEQEELKSARHSAEAAKAEAERASAAKDRFIAALSHELRTPLTPALVVATNLAHDPRMPQDLREEAEIIRRNIDLEVALINDLLDVTRVANGKLALSRQTVDLGPIVREAAAICAADVRSKQHRLTMDLPDAPCLVEGDAPRLHQVFWNLIRNAVKFTPSGGEIRITAAASDGNVIVQVADTGIGIKPEVLPSLFAAFEQGDRGHQFGGLGLGLAIAKGVVELHGGTISASSKGPGTGSTFTVTLPLSAAPPATGHQAPLPPIHVSNKQPRRSLRILLVEDHQDTARIMARLLSVGGHQVTRAANVAAALTAAGEGQFDLLISDLGLPDGSGHELMRRLRSAGHDLPAIALSGYGAAEDVQRSMDAGFREHLVKPVRIEALREALNRVSSAV